MKMIFTISWFLYDNHDDEGDVFTKGLGERLHAADAVVPTLQSRHHAQLVAIEMFLFLKFKF